jgi:sterol desaturase/sphingolipid hydroxylase (fatty acid hydroxylase superfamily)
MERSDLIRQGGRMEHAHRLVRLAISWSAIVMIVSITACIVAEHVAVRLGRRRAATGRRQSITAALFYVATKGIVSKLLMFGVAMYVYRNWRLTTLDLNSPLTWIGVFVARDFVYYWIHRAEHVNPWLWASHQIHHSSTEFSHTTAVRMPWMESVYKPLLGLWVPLIGFHPLAFAAMGAAVLAVGQWQHTELLAGRRRLDRWLVTPSVHRVHHGSNERYLDKNYSSMLSIWDRMFGTFEPETEPVVYGLAGDRQLDTTHDMLVGGYPALLRSRRAAAAV